MTLNDLALIQEAKQRPACWIIGLMNKAETDEARETLLDMARSRYHRENP